MANDLSLIGSTLLGRSLFPGGAEIFRAAARRVCLVAGCVVALAPTTLGPGGPIQHGRQHVAGSRDGDPACRSAARHTKPAGGQHAGWTGRADLPPGTGSAAGSAGPGSTGRCCLPGGDGGPLMPARRARRTAHAGAAPRVGRLASRFRYIDRRLHDHAIPRKLPVGRMLERGQTPARRPGREVAPDAVYENGRKPAAYAGSGRCRRRSRWS